MRSKLLLSLIIALSASTVALAAPQGMGKGQSQQGMGQGDMQRDRMMDKDKMHDQKMDRDRMHDRMHQDSMSMMGYSLMTPEERQAYHQQMMNAKTAEERQQLMQQHREMMMQRAEQQGVDLEDRPIFGRQLMTQEERNQYREQLYQAKDDAERQQIRAQHREEMLQRARERNVTLDDDSGDN